MHERLEALDSPVGFTSTSRDGRVTQSLQYRAELPVREACGHCRLFGFVWVFGFVGFLYWS